MKSDALTPGRAAQNTVTLGWILALIALLMRPILLQHLIKLQLVILKRNGQI